MRKKVILTTAVIILMLIPGPAKVFASINISSPMAVLIDAETGQVLYEKNADGSAYPASTTKIMTAVLALERGNLSDYVPISKKASYIDGSRIYLLEGERVTLEQLLYGLLLESGNDAAIAIAEYIAGSVEEFSIMMNDKAEQLSAQNTNFVNPNGLPDTEHITCAYDMALIAKHAMTLPEFREIVGTNRYVIPETNMQDMRYLYNGNRLIKNTSHKYEGANGIKTGYTVAAKHCFVGSAERDGRKFITVILSEADNDTLWNNTTALFDYAFDCFQKLPVVNREEVIDSVEFLGTDSTVKIVTEEGFHYNYPFDDEKPIITKNVVLEKIKPTVPDGERVGYIEYKIGDRLAGTIRLIARRDDEKRIKTSGILKNASGGLKSGFFGVLLVLPIFVLTFRFIVKSRKRRRFSYGRTRGLFRRR